MKRENVLSSSVIGAAIEVYRHLGPGLLETAHEEALSRELTIRSFIFNRQVSLPLEYKDVKLTCGYRLDFLVDNCLVVELKSVDAFAPIHEAQDLTYLRLAKCKLCLLINFNVPVLRDGIKRVALNL